MEIGYGRGFRSIYNVAMRVTVEVKRLTDKGIQVAVRKSESQPKSRAVFRSEARAREVLMNLGLEPNVVERTLVLLRAVETGEPLYFPEQEVDIHVLGSLGFAIAHEQNGELNTADSSPGVE